MSDGLRAKLDCLHLCVFREAAERGDSMKYTKALSGKNPAQVVMEYAKHFGLYHTRDDGGNLSRHAEKSGWVSPLNYGHVPAFT